MSVTARYTPVLPEGYVARFEHRRWVVLETIVTVDGTDYPVWSQPTLMTSHEWTRLREHDEPFTKTHVLPNGGVTLCRVYKQGDGTDEDPDELVLMVESHCAWEDNYVKALGRNYTLDAARRTLLTLLAATEYETVDAQPGQPIETEKVVT